MASSNFLHRINKHTSSVFTSIWKGFNTMATNEKQARVVKTIGTHSGVFHCDEVLACYMLKQLPEYEAAEIIRSRDPKVLETCDLVVDVGGEYNPKTHRYDHHQKGFEETMSSVRPDLVKNKLIKLSSAGLVYAHFGMEVISSILKKNKFDSNTECLRILFGHIYDVFVEEMDAIDNGVPMYGSGQPRYRINTHLSARVHKLNPEWNSSNTESPDKLFTKAMDLVGQEFKETVLSAFSVWWPARDILKKSIESRKKVYESGEIVVLEERCPWKEHLYAIEEELGISGQIKFCIFHDSTDSWRVQGIPVQPDSFICRLFLHKDWRGVRDDQLSSVAGIKNCIFCHATGFIGGNKTREGAMQMAIASLKTAAINQE